MPLFYSQSTGGFYDDSFHTTIPSDAVPITVDEHSSLLAGQAAGQIITADASGNPLLTEPVVSILQLITNKRATIEAARTTLEQEGCSYTFPDSVQDIVQLRDNTDKLNLSSQVTMAQLLSAQGITDPVLPFQAKSNVTHVMTPAQMIALGITVSTYISGLYQIQWTQKALLNALDPTTATAADVAAIADWPTTPTV